ncbi:hypothetical protein M0R45_025737 [Rubus argutus]|uniref:C-JID domain-containing protein n=1 Tax=Rubus argutus TaxID=59490 RepID=A0AAW1WXA0_RUBAR
MGREIVRQESLDEPGKRSRLWLREDINHVLSKNIGTDAIEGIFVDSTESGGDVDVNAKSFSLMSKLRYLKINNGNLPNGLECLPNSLRILQWTGYPLKSLPQHFNLEKMIELSLCHSCFTHFHPGMEIFNNLKSIDLSHSVNLWSTPDFRVMPYLEDPETWYFNHLCAYCEHDIFEFVAPGNKIPEWYNCCQGSSIVVELHPGWFSNKWMGFALCAVFRLRKPLPKNAYQIIYCSLEANGVQVSSIFPCVNRQEWGQPVSDHIWLFYLHRDRHSYLGNNWQDIYYQLKFSFNKWKKNSAVEVKNCGVRTIYEEDVKELRQILWKQSNVGINTKRGLQQLI